MGGIQTPRTGWRRQSRQRIGKAKTGKLNWVSDENVLIYSSKAKTSPMLSLYFLNLRIASSLKYALKYFKEALQAVLVCMCMLLVSIQVSF